MPLGQIQIPSPLLQVSTTWSIAAGINLFLKRDDLIHPIISGNKWRKLSGFLEKYPTTKKIITFGGAFSNHLVATAAAGAMLKIPTVGNIRGDYFKELNPVLTLCKLYGMHLEFINHLQYDELKNKSLIVDNELFIPEGGSGILGTIGLQKVIEEMQYATHQSDYLITACGTGTTLAGLLLASKKSAFPTRIIGVQVLKGKDYIKNHLQESYQGLEAQVWDEFHFGGYAKTNPELLAFIADFAKQTGVLLDPIYTGKALWAIKSKANEDFFEKGATVTMLHTGGLTGWFGKYKEVDL